MVFFVGKVEKLFVLYLTSPKNMQHPQWGARPHFVCFRQILKILVIFLLLFFIGNDVSIFVDFRFVGLRTGSRGLVIR